MEHILTNDMLLENTRSVANFAPSMLTLFLYFYLNVQISTGSVRSLDGIVGAVIVNGKFYITSANADYIPFPPLDNRQVKLRADTRYGDDDPTQWPQPYIQFHCHLAAIPRPNTLLDHLVIWWTPTIADLTCPPHSGPVSGLWKLREQKYNELRTSVQFLTKRVTKYQQSIPPDRKPIAIHPSVKWLQQVLDQLLLVQMSLRHIEFVVRDLQRVWLNVWAILDYTEIYKPRMDGDTPPVGGVADTIGTFTSRIRVAQDMFLAGLPCWLIRDSKTFSDEKIFRIAELFHPKDYIVLAPHKFNYPVIFKGLSTDYQMHRAIELYARNFLCSQDPFAIISTPSSLAGASQPSQPSTLSTPPVASSSATPHSTGRNSWGAGDSQPSTSYTPAVASSSATRPSTGRNSRGVTRRPGRGRGAGKSFLFDIFQYYYINSLLKVLNNRPAIKGVTNSSRSRTSPLHHCRSPPGPVPWLPLMMIPLVWMRDIARQMIASMFFLNLAFSLAPMRYDGRGTSSLGKH
jgi:hypothetical protein